MAGDVPKCGSCWQGPRVQYWPCQSDCARGGFSGHLSASSLSSVWHPPWLQSTLQPGFWCTGKGLRYGQPLQQRCSLCSLGGPPPALWWTTCAHVEIGVRAKRMRSPAKLSSQTTFSVCSAASCLHSRGVVQSAVEPKGRVASFPHVSGADSKGIEVLNPVGARTQPCSALMPSETKRPASNPTHQLPCGKSRRGLRFRKRY